MKNSGRRGRGEPMQDNVGQDLRPVSGRHVRIASWTMLVLTVSAMGILSSLAVSQRQVTQKLLADFGVEVSAVTKIAISIPSAAIVGAAAIGSVVLAVKEWLMHDKRTALILNLAAFTVSILLYVIHREALISPLQKLLIELTSMR